VWCDRSIDHLVLASEEVREEEVDELASDPDHQALLTTAHNSAEECITTTTKRLLHPPQQSSSSVLLYERAETSLTDLSGGVGLLYMEYHDNNA
jgi:hypothetical protein